MGNERRTPQQIVERGREIYERQLRPQLEARHHGEYVVINTESGDYEIGADDLLVSKRAKARFGDAPLFTMRIGHETAYRLGGGSVIIDALGE